jgi:hypothetical protein
MQQEERLVTDQLSFQDLDIWSGKTCPEPLVQTKEKTSERSLKKSARSVTPKYLFLDLRKTSGLVPEPYWEKGIPWHGGSWTHNTGECPNVVVESTLSQILEATPHPKYCLSKKACQGILRRAAKRGKELPPMLKEALEAQANAE